MSTGNDDVQSIEPIRELDAGVDAPPSKAHTLRGLFIASLAAGRSTLSNALHAEDQQHAARALSSFGADVHYKDGDFEVNGVDHQPRTPDNTVYTGQSGVTSRFILPIAALAPGRTRIDADEQMRTRPMGDLVDALRMAGVQLSSNDGCLPIDVEGNTWTKHRLTVSVRESSQYLSALLIAAPAVDGGLTVEIDGELRSSPYVTMTERVMSSFGARVEHPDPQTYHVPDEASYEAQPFSVEGDYSSASYFMAAAAVTGGHVRVNNLQRDSVQGDRAITRLLSDMGCDISWTDDGVSVTGGDLNGITADMSNIPDLVPTVAVVASFAEGTTRIENVGHLAYKESDRLQSISHNLTACGIEHEVTDTALEIQGSQPGPATIDPFGDHRIAMAFAVAGLAVPGISIADPHVVAKSFPGFFEALDTLYVSSP
jgi:3-phosphoshikimate 1-carboxyvinyltransferase